MLELDARLLGREAPVHGDFLGVPGRFPGSGFLPEGLLIGKAPIQTLLSQRRQFNLGHVQPTAMFGRIVQFQPLDQAPRFWSRLAGCHSCSKMA